MTEKYIPLEATKKAIFETWGKKNVGDAFGLVEIGKILDSLAIPVEDGAIEECLTHYEDDSWSNAQIKDIEKARIELAALRYPVDMGDYGVEK